jgi:hypothetical protein
MVMRGKVLFLTMILMMTYLGSPSPLAEAYIEANKMDKMYYVQPDDFCYPNVPAAKNKADELEELIRDDPSNSLTTNIAEVTDDDSKSTSSGFFKDHSCITFDSPKTEANAQTPAVVGLVLLKYTEQQCQYIETLMRSVASVLELPNILSLDGFSTGFVTSLQW